MDDFMYDEIINKIKEYDNIVICRHVGVDPDALSSQIGLRDSIKLTYPNKKVIAIGSGGGRFKIGRLDKFKKLDNALLIVCDTPDVKRIECPNLDDYKYIIKIDHHPFVDDFANIDLINDTSSSASEVIMNLIYNTELKCNSSIAETLYLGLVSDSNRFLFNSCTYETFDIVSKYLKEYPFNLNESYNKIYARPLKEFRFEGYIRQNLIVTENGLGYINITNDILEKFEVDSASAGNMINNFNFVNEIIVWSTITEDVKNNQIRVSIRSRGPEIKQIAEKYNGGGHLFASGIKFKTMDEANKFIEELDLLLELYNRGEEYYDN